MPIFIFICVSSSTECQLTMHSKHSQRASPNFFFARVISIDMPESRKKLLLKRKACKRSLKHLSSRHGPCLRNNKGCIEIQTLNFTSASSLFTSLLSPATSETAFLKDYWELKPLVVKRRPSATSQHYSTDYSSLFSLRDLRDLASSGCIHYGRNINVCRYVSGMRECLNGDGVASVKELDRLWKREKATFQFHQPQQYKVYRQWTSNKIASLYL